MKSVDKVIEEKMRRIEGEEQAKAREARKKQQTMIYERITPHSENAVLLLAVAFYVPLVLLASDLPIVSWLGGYAIHVQLGLSAVAVGSTILYAGLSIAKGYNERAATSFVELYIKHKGKTTRTWKRVQVLKTTLYLWDNLAEEYDKEALTEKMRRGQIKELPLFAEQFFGAYSPRDDFVLVSRGLKPSDILQEEVSDVDGKWSSGLGTLYPCNIVEEYVNPVPRSGMEEKLPVYFLLANPKMVNIMGSAADVLAGLSPQEFIDAASSAGMFDGLYWREKALSSGVEIAQKDRIIDETRGQALRIAAKAIITLKKDLSVLGELNVEDMLKPERNDWPHRLIDKPWKKIVWACIGIILIATILYFTVGGGIALFTGGS